MSHLLPRVPAGLVDCGEDASGPGFHSLLHAGGGQGGAGVVGGLEEAEVGRQHHGLVQAQGPQDLPGYQVPAGVAGDHNGVQVFVI